MLAVQKYSSIDNLIKQNFKERIEGCPRQGLNLDGLV